MREQVLAYLAEQARLPFEWGKTDCIQVAAGWYERVNAVRPKLPFEYASELEAKRGLVELGGFEAAVSAVLGPAQRDLRLCGDGDFVLSAFGGEHTIGIALPRVFIVRRQRDGSLLDPDFVPLDMTLAIRWWPCRIS